MRNNTYIKKNSRRLKYPLKFAMKRWELFQFYFYNIKYSMKKFLNSFKRLKKICNNEKIKFIQDLILF